MNIEGLDKSEVLATLYNNAKVQGLGFLDPDCNKQMTKGQAQILLDKTPNKYFDYVQGRVMKIRIDGDEIDTRLYNRDNGQDSAENAIKTIR